MNDEQGRLKFDFDSDFDDFGDDFDEEEFKAVRIAVIGVGGGGGNAVGTMIERDVANVTHMICNTDVQALRMSKVPLRLQIGKRVAGGKGAGGKPSVGKEAAEESLAVLEEKIKGVDMLFITCGMGGGTGTGAAPRIAKLARELGILTVGVVTRPFSFEGKKRERFAVEGIEEMKENVNTLVVIPNEKLFELDPDMPFIAAFKRADEVLVNAVRGISDLITTAGYVNLDFADVSTIMANMGMAIMGSATASGPNRAMEAAQQAISSPLLDNLKIEGAKGILVNVTGSMDLSLSEVREAVSYIEERADAEADLIFGYVIDPEFDDAVKVTVIATGCPDSRPASVDPLRRKMSFPKNIDIPAVKRKAAMQETAHARVMPPPLPDEEDLFNKPFASVRRVNEARQVDDQVKIPSFRRRVLQNRKAR